MGLAPSVNDMIRDSITLDEDNDGDLDLSLLMFMNEVNPAPDATGLVRIGDGAAQPHELYSLPGPRKTTRCRRQLSPTMPAVARIIVWNLWTEPPQIIRQRSHL